ncbi:MAG: 50S ribosomal protein L25 [bacterium]|nr:50S ribosomal protein L25 [bacterium]
MKLDARKRAAGGAGPLRRDGHLPAVVYNRNLNLSVSVELKAFDRVFRSQGTSSVVDLDVDGEIHAVLVKAVQMDKRRRIPQHVDFFAVTAGQVVSVHVPIEFVGTAAGTREGGQLDVQRREVHISILPRLIPNHLELDVSGLAVGDSLHVRDLQAILPPEAHVLDDLDLAIVAVVPPRVASDDAASAEGEGEPEVIARGGEDAEG